MEVKQREMLELSCRGILGRVVQKVQTCVCLSLSIVNRPYYHKIDKMYMQQVIDGSFGFQQQALPPGSNNMEQSTTAVLHVGAPSWKHYERGLCSVLCGQLDNDHDLLLFFFYCYLVVCCISLLVTDKFEMTIVLLTKCDV